MAASLRALPPWWIVAAVLVVAAGLGLAAVVGVSDALPGDIANVMTFREPIDAGGGLSIDNPASISGTAEASESALWLLLLIGPPATVLAVVLRRLQGRSRPWGIGWHQLFAAGFICQLSSLVISTLLLGLFGWEFREFLSDLAFLIGLLSIVLFNLWGLHCWRVLYRQPEEPPLSVTLEDTARQLGGPEGPQLRTFKP